MTTHALCPFPQHTFTYIHLHSPTFTYIHLHSPTLIHIDTSQPHPMVCIIALGYRVRRSPYATSYAMSMALASVCLPSRTAKTLALYLSRNSLSESTCSPFLASLLSACSRRSRMASP